MRTTNKTRMPSKVIMAERAVFRSPIRVSIGNPTSFSYSLILDKALQLPKSPLMNPFVVSTPSSDVCQIFHYDCCSCWNAINDSLAYSMVSYSHKPETSFADIQEEKKLKRLSDELSTKEKFWELLDEFDEREDERKKI